jgi:hypothetical protein
MAIQNKKTPKKTVQNKKKINTKTAPKKHINNIKSNSQSINELADKEESKTINQKEDISLEQLIAITLQEVNTSNERKNKLNENTQNKSENSIIIYEDGVEMRMNGRIIQIVKNDEETFRIVTKKKLTEDVKDNDFDPVKVRIEYDEQKNRYGVMDFLISEDALSAIIVGYNKFNLSEKRVMNNETKKN